MSNNRDAFNWYNAENLQEKFHCVKISERKARLFAAACCRRMSKKLKTNAWEEEILKAEQYADGEVSARDLAQTRMDFLKRYFEPLANQNPGTIRPSNYRAYLAVSHLIHIRPAEFTPINVAFCASQIDYSREDVAQEERYQMKLLDFMVKPFETVPKLKCSRNTLQIAQALYSEQGNIAAPLHDSLIEDGHQEFANEHFPTCFVGEYPKGYWALDAILGKE